MIDFWEIIGRTVVDDPFRNQMFSAFAQSKAAANPDQGNTFACLFSDADYDQARQLVLGKMGPVSLLALGEWLVVSVLHRDSQPSLDNVAKIVQGSLKGYTSADPLFYQTLGAAVVDSGFRDEFNNNGEKAFGFNLSANDRQALAPIIADGGFGTQSSTFHDDTWDDACKDMVIQSQGHPYAHALEDKFAS